jgi:hypothetical protein
LKVFIFILNYIDAAAPLLTLLFFIRPFSRMQQELRYIFYFVLMQFLTNTLATVLELAEIRNYLVYVVNIVLSFLILTLLFYHQENPLIKKVIPVFTLAFIIAGVVSLAQGDGINTFNSVLSAVASFAIICYCLIYFYWKLVRDIKLSGLTNSAFFWVIIGVFTYYTGSFFIFISYKYLIVPEANTIGILWRFHNLLLSIFCFYTIYALTCKNYRKT